MTAHVRSPGSALSSRSPRGRADPASLPAGLRPVVAAVRWASCVTALVLAAVIFALRPWTWGRVYREQLAEQVLRAVVDGSVLVAPVAMILGAIGVAMASVWLASVGQASLLPALVVQLLVTGLVPLLANTVVIGRSGCSAAAHLASLTIGGQVRALDAQGVDPFCFFVAPRIIAFALAALFLTVVFAVVSMTAGYVAAASLGVLRSDPFEFARSLLDQLTPVSLGVIVVKSFVPGAVTGAICCLNGLEPAPHPGSVARAVRLAFSQSLVAVIVTMGVITLAGVLIAPRF